MPISLNSARVTALVVSLLVILPGLAGLAAAQTTPSQTAPAQTAPVTAAPVSGATAKAVSAVAIEVSAAVKGQIISCPKALKVSVRGVCLYVKTGAPALRPVIKGRLAGRAVGEWKTTGKTSTLLVTEKVGGPLGAFVLISSLADTESLVVIDAVQTGTSAAAPKVAPPEGVVRGQPYVLGSDLAGLVKVTSLGGGKYLLSAEDQPALTVTVGQKNAQVGGGTVELPLAPATDGKNLIFPLAGLRALGCTVTPAGTSLTVACGMGSLGLKPIVF